MTPERLAEIRDSLGRELGMWTNDSQAAADLLAEVERLREGVSRLHASVERWHGSMSRDRADSLIRETLRDLLNPPTEGETDDPA